ncbi:MAG: protein kinase domain-containing protein [Kofleriaceae bacterium]
MRAVESADLTGAVLDGRYKVLETVAKGAMGTVYRAERLKLGKIVAVKVLHDELPDELSSRKRFEIEAMAMAKLEHPNCAAVLDVGVHDGRPFVVMDYITGTDLKTLVDAGPVPGPRAISIVRQVLSGLAHAHELGIIHRDIKPANIILGQKAGLGDHVKILDFGLARLQAESSVSRLTTGIVVGTPAYMAPEQIRGTAIDARADLYACGILLFELLTGKKPFSSPKDDPIEVVSMHLKNPVPRLDAMLPGTDFGELETVVARALQKAADDRFQTATDFVAALDAIHRAIEQSQAISASMMIPAGDTRLGVPAHAAKIASGPVASAPAAIPKAASGPVASAPAAIPKAASGPVVSASAAIPKAASGPVASASNVASGPTASRTTDVGVAAHAPDSVPPVATHERTPTPGTTPSTSEPTVMRRGSFDSHDAPVGLGLVNGARARTPTAPGTLAPAAFVPKPPVDEPFTGASTPLVAPVIPTRPDTDPMVHLPPVALPPPSDAATKLPFRLERKHVLIGGGALFVLVVIIIGATRGDDAPSKKPPIATQQPATTKKTSGSAPAPVEPPHVEMPGDDPTTEQGVMDRALADIAAGRTDAALGLLLRSRKKYAQNGEIPYLAGTLHFKKQAWADGLAMFREALKIDPYYATNGDFIKTVVKGFATTPAYNDDIAKFLRDQIGSPAEAYLDEVANSHADATIRKRAADELKTYQPR